MMWPLLISLTTHNSSPLVLYYTNSGKKCNIPHAAKSNSSGPPQILVLRLGHSMHQPALWLTPQHRHQVLQDAFPDITSSRMPSLIPTTLD